jgi:glycosyltransferase involved in cell wall biosynthesis
MRIAYVFDQLLPRTAADTEQVVSTVSALGKAGVDVDLVLPRARGVAPVDAAALGKWYDVEPNFTVHTIGSVYPAHRGLEKAGHAVAGALAEATRHADLVYTRNIPVLLALLARARQPIVYEHFRPWPTQSRAMALLFSRIARLRRPPALVMHSAFAAQSYLDVGFAPERTLVAHNGWDPKLMEPVLDRAAARAACGIASDGPVVLYSGHINERKGLGTLLDLAQTFRDARFVLVGSEGHGPIEARAAGLPNVEVRPWCSRRELVPLLYAADILAVPPTSGPLQKVGNTVLPLKTFIYLAAGRAIFAGDTPDLHELLRDGDNARLARPDDATDARRVMGELLADDDLRARLGERARASAQSLTWAARGRRLAAFLEGLR